MLILLLPAAGLFAQERGEDYARYLFSKGFYTESRSEFLYQSYAAKDEAARGRNLFWASKSLLEHGDFSRAEAELYSLSKEKDAELQKAARFEYLRALYFQKRYDTIETESLPEAGRNEQIILFWSFIGNSEWESAERLSRSIIEKEGPENEEMNSFRAAAGLVQKRPSFERVSPLLAASLSAAFPGAGHAYAGSWTNAAGSFLLNSIFITLTAYSWHTKNYAAAAFCGFLEIGWYAGNIVSAHQTASFANDAAERNYRKRVQNLFPYAAGYSYRF
jgi:hypothetical protein